MRCCIWPRQRNSRLEAVHHDDDGSIETLLRPPGCILAGYSAHRLWGWVSAAAQSHPDQYGYAHSHADLLAYFNPIADQNANPDVYTHQNTHSSFSDP